MRRHIVGAFEIVHEGGIAVGDESRGERFEVAADGRVGVLTDDQRRAGVLHEDVAQASYDFRPADDLLDGPGDLVGRTASSIECQTLAMNHRSLQGWRQDSPMGPTWRSCRVMRDESARLRLGKG